MILNDPHVRYSAAQYNHYTRAFVDPYDRLMIQWITLQAARLPAHFTLADIGTGTAQLLLKLAATPQFAHCRMIGTDLFPDMLAEAQAEVLAAGLQDRIRLFVDDIHASSLEDNAADLVISRSTLHHWSHPALALQQINRVLRPGARALIVDVRRDAPAEVIAEFNRQRAQAGLPPSVLEEKSTVAEVEAIVREAGLSEVAEVSAGNTGLAVSIRKPAAA